MTYLQAAPTLPASPAEHPEESRGEATAPLPVLPLAEPRSTGAQRLLILLALVLLALAQVLWAGYRLGVGNQSIQIPFLKHAINPNLYAHDPMVQETLAAYPSYFFQGLAAIVSRFGLSGVYFWLHLLTALSVLAATAAMTRAMFKDRSAGFVVILLLLAGHHQALAGDELYSAGFTHTWAVFPLAIFAILLLYRGLPLAAFAVAGLIFNLHALTASYLAFMFGIWSLGECLLGARATVRWYKLPGYALIFLLLASPTLRAMAHQHQAFSTEWINLTHIRSADHSFPSTWWEDGSADVPRFALLVALGALSLGFAMPREQRRKTLLMAAAVGLLFVIGYVFSEIHPRVSGLAGPRPIVFLIDHVLSAIRPRPEVLRAQLFRSSRLLLVIVFCHIGYGIARGLQFAKATASGSLAPVLRGEGWGEGSNRELRDRRNSSLDPSPLPSPLSTGERGDAPIPHWRRRLEGVNAVVTLLCVAVPALLPLLPYAVLLGTIVALINGRLSWAAALVAGASLLICVLAWEHIRFAIPGWGHGATSWWKWIGPAGGALGWLALIAGATMWAIARRLRNRDGLEFAAVLGLAITPALLLVASNRLAGASATDPWVQAQTWARNHSPANAVFLTPAQYGGFRIDSERAVVGEWRDGTQLYFSAAFAPEWWKRMTSLQPGLMSDTSGRNLMSRGKAIDDLDDAALIKLCKDYNADYIVLPSHDGDAAPRELALDYANAQWAIYRPVLVAPPKPATPEDAQAKFMRAVVWPNIEKYRKSDARVQIVDTAGRPVQDLPFEVREVTADFKWSTALNFFKVPEAPTFGDFKPGAVQPEELKRFPEIFNFSLIPFSGKWMYVEPQQGQRDYADLDAYVDWCTSHQIGMEFHFLSGYAARWVTSLPLDQQQAFFIKHATDLVARYKGRIEYYQVVNERHGISICPKVFEEIRKVDPDAKFGISDCSQFWIPRPERFRNSASPYMGMAEVRWLKSQGVKLDFFAFHGHRPFGLWPDPQQMYTALDAFAGEGLRIHISEFTVPMGGPIIGPNRKQPYEKWTLEKQAEYYAWFYTVCFSHPSVDMINLWGIGSDTWQPGSGLLDDELQPKPNFFALKELIKVKFMTRYSGQLPLDGATAFRGFHGGYEIALTLPGGQVVTGNFAVKKGQLNNARLVLDREKKTLTQ